MLHWNWKSTFTTSTRAEIVVHCIEECEDLKGYAYFVFRVRAHEKEK